MEQWVTIMLTDGVDEFILFWTAFFDSGLLYILVPFLLIACLDIGLSVYYRRRD